MSIPQITFIGLSLMALISAIMVLTSKKPIYSILYLIFTFFCIAAHFVLLNAQFLAVVQVIVYAGAIMVLFLFVVMLLNMEHESRNVQSALSKGAAVVSGGLLLLVIVGGFAKSNGTGLDVAQASYPFTEIGHVKNLGQALFNEFLIPFEVVSILFLTAMVGAVVLGRRD